MAKPKLINKGKLTRIGNNFNDEIEEIQRLRLESRIDRKKKSIRRLTDLLIHHKDWNKIKQDTIKLNLENMKDE